MSASRDAIHFLAKEARLADSQGNVTKARHLRAEIWDVFTTRVRQAAFDSYDFVVGHESGVIFNVI